MNKIPSLKNSVFGKASLIFGVISIITFSISTQLASFFLSDTNETQIKLLGIFILVLIIPSLIGFILGLCGIRQSNKKREFACIGLALNGGILAMTFSWFILVMFMANLNSFFL